MPNVCSNNETTMEKPRSVIIVGMFADVAPDDPECRRKAMANIYKALALEALQVRHDSRKLVLESLSLKRMTTLAVDAV